LDRLLHHINQNWKLFFHHLWFTEGSGSKFPDFHSEDPDMKLIILNPEHWLNNESVKVAESGTHVRYYENIWWIRFSLVDEIHRGGRMSGRQCKCCNSPGFSLRHGGIWGAADDAVLNTVKWINEKAYPVIVVQDLFAGKTKTWYFLIWKSEMQPNSKLWKKNSIPQHCKSQTQSLSNIFYFWWQLACGRQLLTCE